MILALVLAFLAAIFTPAGRIGFTAPECYQVINGGLDTVRCDAYRFERWDRDLTAWQPATGWDDSLQAALTPSDPGTAERVRFSFSERPALALAGGTHLRVFAIKAGVEGPPSNLLSARVTTQTSGSPADSVYLQGAGPWRAPRDGVALFWQARWDTVQRKIESQSEVQWRLRKRICELFPCYGVAGECVPCP